IASAQLREVSDLLRRFETKLEAGGRSLRPSFDRLRTRNSAKRIIDLGRGKALRVVGQHLTDGQRLGIKCPLPFRILKTRCTDPEIHHQQSYSEPGGSIKLRSRSC